jgi:CDGSH-type Zn-finger protein
MSEKSKMSIEDLKTKSREYHQNYYRKNKELVKQLYEESKKDHVIEVEKEKSILCACGGSYKAHRKDSHYISHRHILYLVKNANKIKLEKEEPIIEEQEEVKPIIIPGFLKKTACECGALLYPYEMKVKKNLHDKTDKHLKNKPVINTVGSIDV